MKNGATVLGAIVAGIWAYFNYFRGRTFRPRLEPQVSARLVSNSNVSYLSVTYSIKNVGLSKVDLKRKGTALVVQLPDLSQAVQFLGQVRWRPEGAFDVFESHKWIEPGELIQEQLVLLAIPADKHNYLRVDLRVVSPVGIEWNGNDSCHRSIADSERTRCDGVADDISGRTGIRASRNYCCNRKAQGKAKADRTKDRIERGETIDSASRKRTGAKGKTKPKA